MEIFKNNSQPTADTISDELMITFEPLAANEADVSLRSLFWGERMLEGGQKHSN